MTSRRPQGPYAPRAQSAPTKPENSTVVMRRNLFRLSDEQWVQG